MDVAILGASSNPTRYAYLAAQRLVAAGHRVTGINPALPDVPGIEVVKSIEALSPGCHTLTMYVGQPRSNAVAGAVVGYGFARVIFNPGAENAALEQQLRDANVEVVEACTLVMLATGLF